MRRVSGRESGVRGRLEGGDLGATGVEGGCNDGEDWVPLLADGWGFGGPVERGLEDLDGRLFQHVQMVR